MENDTKMSEDESSSLKDSESEDEKDSNSGSIDEEIKLNENFIKILEKISTNNKNYDDYVLMVCW